MTVNFEPIAETAEDIRARFDRAVDRFSADFGSTLADIAAHPSHQNKLARRTRQVLSMVFGRQSRIERMATRFERAIERWSVFIRILDEIADKPRHNEKLDRAELLLRVLEIGAEEAAWLAAENQIHPNSTWLRKRPAPPVEAPTVGQRLDEMDGNAAGIWGIDQDVLEH